MGIQGIENLHPQGFEVEHTEHDDEDVAAALARDTQDGRGFEDEELPPSDFEEDSSDDDQV